jgi:flagellar protein FlaG
MDDVQVRSAGRVEGQNPGRVDQGSVPPIRRSDPETNTAAKSREHRPQTDSKTVAQISEVAQRVFRDLQFSVDQDSGSVVVKVVDRGTGDVLRQIPAEEMLKLARTLTGLDSHREQSAGSPAIQHAPKADAEVTGILIQTKV